jgi:hypothetical protein
MEFSRCTGVAPT